MHEQPNIQATNVSRQAWVEPEIRQLDVRETAFTSAMGADGETNYADCTKS